jgi:hypothetical protein
MSTSGVFCKNPVRGLGSKQKAEKRARVLQRRRQTQQTKYNERFDGPSESRMWGFKVKYSAHADVVGVELEADRKREKKTRQQMRQEDAAARQLAERDARDDYMLYLLCVERWGALPGEMYCTHSVSTRGQAFLQLANESASRLQRWWSNVRSADTVSVASQGGCANASIGRDNVTEGKE